MKISGKYICIAISDRTFKRISFEKNNKSNKRGKFCEWFDDACKKFKSLVNEKRKTFQKALKNKLNHLQLESHKKIVLR